MRPFAMAKLTEPMIIARSKSSDLNTIRNLNCWGNELTDVSLLQRMTNVEVLALSVNNISSLADFRYCSKLRELYLRKNSIARLNEVCYLQDCAALQNLNLKENPCTDLEGYRLAVVRALPRLQKLDDVEVTDEERRSAQRQGQDLLHPEDEDGQSWPRQTYHDPNGYTNGGKYEGEESAWEGIEEPAPAETNGRQSSSSPEAANEVLVAHKMSPDQTPPESESPEPQQQYQHDDYSERRSVSFNTDVSGYSQRRDSTQSYHSSGQSYQQQPAYQPAPPTPNSPDPPHPVGPRRRPKEASSPEVVRTPHSPSSPPVFPQNNPPTPNSPADLSPRMQACEPRACPEQLSLYPANNQDEDYYYRHQQQPRHRLQHSSSMQQIPPPVVPITGNGRPKSRTANILSAVLCLLKELDYQSLEVVDNTVNARMNELMHEHNA